MTLTNGTVSNAMGMYDGYCTPYYLNAGSSDTSILPL